ncbi:hypothetical protein HMN09_00610400 [Mycena chlorophos]|uniref:Uncharacterized protein n=1 Tax=Mycena chlorophos TaxID=658473 RepID=A0A8H6T779_MYCCL|nr:hypothetical protein HMN09_00610400 [Mycena chlorophos]
MLPPERIPLGPKCQNIPILAVPRKHNKPVLPALTISRPTASNVTICDDSAPETPLVSTPFELPPMLATSPLRLPFLDLTVQSSPEPPALGLPSVCNPNSPYVPWESPVRRRYLRPLASPTPSQVSRYSRPESRSGARAPEPTAPPRRFVRLSKSLKNIKQSLKQGVRHVKNALCRTQKTRPAPRPTPPVTPPIPSPSVSCESSKTNTLADWLRDCATHIDSATPNYMTLEEYEERGSWRERDSRSVDAESEVASPRLSVFRGDHTSSRVASPSPGPISTICTDSDVFPRLSRLDLWPAPPGSAPDWSLDRDRMPGGWTSSPVRKPYEQSVNCIDA